MNLLLETMQGLAHRLQQIEGKVDKLATKADLEAVFISLEGKQVSSKKPLARALFKDKDPD